MKIVQFGAGNIGRSLVGQLFSRAGWEVVFVDTVPEIIDALNRDRAYDVIVKDERPETIRVSGVRGVLATETERVVDEVASADLVATAVGPAALVHVYPLLAAGLQRRLAPLNVVLCENLRGAALRAREGIVRHLPPGYDLSGRLGLVETSIGKMVPIMPDAVRRARPLEVWAEAYNAIIADGEAFLGPVPKVPGLVCKTCFAAYVDRKLFIHNLGHAVAAYLGFLRGYTYIWETVEDETVRRKVRGAMWESAQALIRRYPSEFDEQNQAEHVDDLLRRFANRALGDSVYRVGRDLPRKLGPDDRLIGAIRLDRAEGIDPMYTLEGLVAGLRFLAPDEFGRPYPADQEFADRICELGIRTVLQETCGLRPDGESDLIERIVSMYSSSVCVH